MKSLSITVAALSLAACRSENVHPFKEPMKLAGRVVGAATLNSGREAYLQYCRMCHGDSGDGKGPAAPGLRPPPRDFKLGEFKFAGVLDQKLPRDEDLVRIVRVGLHGTAMLGWDVPDQKLHDIIQYIKTLSDSWKDDDAVGEPVVPAPDPWGDARKAQAIERGKRVYHGFAQCLNCHPAYAGRAEIAQWQKEMTGSVAEFRENGYQPELKNTDYGVKALPPDFLFNELRSIGPETARPDLYRIIVAGVTGAAMPAWKPETLPEGTKDVWALAYYVKALTEMKGAPAAARLREELAGQQ